MTPSILQQINIFTIASFEIMAGCIALAVAIAAALVAITIFRGFFWAMFHRRAGRCVSCGAMPQNREVK
jgi:mannose/fructose/N-acetylgalactosamine-specific phosphotransferase system component IIC